MGFGCASPADLVTLEVSYPRGFILEELYVIWTSFKETCVWLKVL
jgi:hypothetical protein